MEYLSFLVAVGILVSAVSAAPTNTNIQQEDYNSQTTKVQDWNTALHVLHGALGSYLNSGGKEAAEVERMANVGKPIFRITNRFFHDYFKKKHPVMKKDRYDIMSLMSVIEGLPEEAQAQFWGTALTKIAPYVIPHVIDKFTG